MMKQRLVLVAILCVFFVKATYASTWCAFSNFDVSIIGNNVAVVNTTLTSDTSIYVYLADITTDKGRGYLSLLMAASIAGKSVLYGDNSKTLTCGNFPGWSLDTMNPEYLRLKH